jgi:hypothetical protein
MGWTCDPAARTYWFYLVSDLSATVYAEHEKGGADSD